MTDPELTKCPICNGRGALRCDCWPGDCICGWDDEPCDECNGTGWTYPDDAYSFELPAGAGIQEDTSHD